MGHLQAKRETAPLLARDTIYQLYQEILSLVVGDQYLSIFFHSLLNALKSLSFQRRRQLSNCHQCRCKCKHLKLLK